MADPVNANNSQQNQARAPFIGTDKLRTLANQLEPNIVLGPAYYQRDDLARMGIHVLTGIQYINTKYVFYRKGGTTRRKVVGSEIKSQIGFMTERPLITRLVWNRYPDNEDNYREFPVFKTNASAEFSYPASELALDAIGQSFSEDVYSNLWWGDEDLYNFDDPDDPKNADALFNGFHVLLKKDIENGLISKANGNLVPCKAIEAPVDRDDYSAWTIVRDWYNGLNARLHRIPVLIYCSTATGVAIQDAYSNAHNNNRDVTMVAGTPNFTVPELPKVTFVPSDEYGSGDRLICTAVDNFEFGVDGANDDSTIILQVGSDRDAKDLTWQVQTVAGCRVVRIAPDSFAMSDGALVKSGNVTRGDYEKNTLTVQAIQVDGKDAGTVTINGKSDNLAQEWAAGTSLTLKATANAGYKFVKWTNGSTNAEITYVTGNTPDGISAIFAADATAAGAGAEGGKGAGE